MRFLPRFDRIGLATSLAIFSAAVMLLLTLVTLQFVGNTLAQKVEPDIGRDLAELAFQTTDKLDRGLIDNRIIRAPYPCKQVYSRVSYQQRGSKKSFM